MIGVKAENSHFKYVRMYSITGLKMTKICSSLNKLDKKYMSGVVITHSHVKYTTYQPAKVQHKETTKDLSNVLQVLECSHA